MLGTVSGDLFPAKPPAPAPRRRLDIAGLTLPHALRDVALHVDAGEILGVFGLVGSGVERIGRAIFGAEPRVRWRDATLDGTALPRADPRAAVAAGIGFVAAERKREGLIATMSVRDNTTLPFLDRFVRHGMVNNGAARAETRRWIDALHVRTSGPEQEIGKLSGGNQQKICLARWMVGDVSLLILEEPTRGVDLGARREIYAQIRALAARGLAVIVISTDAEEVAGLADRTLVLRDGRIAATHDATAEAADLLAAAAHAARMATA
jgi:ribose transport system ATP-binding protein